MLHEIAQHLDTARQLDRNADTRWIAQLYRTLAHDMMDAAPRNEAANA